MIKTQIIKEKNVPKLVVMDYAEYLRLKAIEKDKIDYYEAHKIKRENKNWVSHADLKKQISVS